MTAMSKTVSLTQLTKHFKKSAPTIRNWIARGLPVAVEADRDKGIPWEFDIQDCDDWYENWMMEREEAAGKSKEGSLAEEYEHEDIVAARKKKIEVETERLQLRLERERGELVPIDEVAQIVERQFGSVKSHLLSLPDKVSPVLVNRSSVKEINDLVREYVYEALDELHLEQLLLDEDEPDTQDTDELAS